MSKLEPEANALIEDCNVINRDGGELDLSVTDTASLLSIAISMKRIADAMQSPNEYGEVGGAAIAGAISRSLRDR